MVVKTERYQPVTPEQFEKIMTRYAMFLDTMNDPEKDPVRPYDPLAQKLVDELKLIREVSKQLQKKKDEDITKAAAILLRILNKHLKGVRVSNGIISQPIYASNSIKTPIVFSQQAAKEAEEAAASMGTEVEQQEEKAD